MILFGLFFIYLYLGSHVFSAETCYVVSEDNFSKCVSYDENDEPPYKLETCGSKSSEFDCQNGLLRFQVVEDDENENSQFKKVDELLKQFEIPPKSLKLLQKGSTELSKGDSFTNKTIMIEGGSKCLTSKFSMTACPEEGSVTSVDLIFDYDKDKSIKARGTGKCLDIYKDSIKLPDNLKNLVFDPSVLSASFRDCDNSNNQKWMFANGVIKSPFSGKCLVANGNSLNLGSCDTKGKWITADAVTEPPKSFPIVPVAIVVVLILIICGAVYWWRRGQSRRDEDDDSYLRRFKKRTSKSSGRRKSERSKSESSSSSKSKSSRPSSSSSASKQRRKSLSASSHRHSSSRDDKRSSSSRDSKSRSRSKSISSSSKYRNDYDGYDEERYLGGVVGGGRDYDRDDYGRGNGRDYGSLESQSSYLYEADVYDYY